MSFPRPMASRRSLPSVRSRWLVVIVVALVLLVAVLVAFAGRYTDLLWFRSVGYSVVFWTTLRTKLLLFGLFGLLMALIVGANLVVAYRLRPPFRPMSPEQQNVERYRVAVEPYLLPVLLAVSGLLGVLAGASAASQWKTWLLWRNAVPFGTKDAQFGKDVSYFAFTYPFQRFVLGFAFAAIVLAIVASLVTHYLFGAVRLQTPGEKFTPAARAHLSVLFGLFVLLKAVAYFLDRYGLAFSSRGIVTGPSYTDVNAVLPAKGILAIIAIICAGLFIANLFSRGWMLPAAGFGVLVISAIVIGGVYPAAIQQFRVKPNQIDRESKYIARNIEATRQAYKIDKIETQQYDAATTVSAAQLRGDTGTLPNARLLDPNVLGPTYDQLQRKKNYFGFPDLLDIDRYNVDGKGTHDYVVAAREVDQSGLADSQRNWINERLIFTHGNGFVMAPANEVESGTGRPVFVEKDIPPVGPLTITQPRIYYGEKSPTYSIVGTTQKEVDGPASGGGEDQATFSYDGKGGVPIDNVLNRALFALKYHEKNLLLSSALTQNSKILFIRNPRVRVQKVAPWLQLDGDPYPAVIGGRITWILDGYTTSDGYPYSERTTLGDVTSDALTQTPGRQAQPRKQVNYIRNSVKATVDAYDGTVTLYQFDAQDPVLRTWMRAFPNTVQPKSSISPELMAHFRYPEDLFKVQRDLLASYHVSDPRAFFNQDDFWSVPADPVQADKNGNGPDQPPYFQLLQVPGEKQPEFNLTTTFVALKRPNLAAFFSASSDPADYGVLRVLRLPTDSNVNGVGQVENSLLSEPTISRDISLLNQQKSEVILGNLLTLPVGKGVLFIQPLYVKAQGGEAFPVLRKVLVSFGDKIGYQDTLAAALDQAIGAGAGQNAPGQGGPTTPPSGGATNQALQQAIDKVNTLYGQAQDALRAGDLETYGKLQKQLGDAISALVQAESGASSSSSPSSSPAPSATATP